MKSTLSDNINIAIENSNEKLTKFKNTNENNDSMSLKSKKMNLKSLKINQINFKNQHNTNLKSMMPRAQISNKNNMSLNNTNDSSIPDERFCKGIFSGKILDKNLTL